MFKNSAITTNRGSHGQGLVEFALVLPLLLLVMFGLMEAGRLLFTYSAIYTASREAARYGSAAGNSGGYIAYYQDCNGMRAAARRVGSLAGIRDTDVQITYDQGTITSTLGSCPVGGVGPVLALGNRVTVSISGQYRPIMPLAGFPPIPITSTSSRTILKNVSIQGTPSAPSSGLPQVFFQEDASSSPEGNPGDAQSIEVVIALSEASEQNVTVNFSVSGSATQGSDFSLNRSNPVVIPAGQIETTIRVLITGDSIDEFDESVVFTIDSTVNANRGSPYLHTSTILDDDSEPYVGFDSVSQSIEESAGSLYVSVVLTNASGHSTTSGKEIWVPFDLDGTATLGQDFVSSANPVVIPAGSASAMMVFPVNDDVIYEGMEAVIVDLGDPVNAGPGSFTRHTAQIEDDELPPRVAFDLESQMASEVQGSVVLGAHLADTLGNPAASELEVVVPLIFSGSALPELDYTTTTSELVFPPGGTSAQTTILLLMDDLVEPEETIIVAMESPVNAELGIPNQHTLTITPQALVSFSSESVSVQEGIQAVDVELTLVPAQTIEVRVPFIVSGTAEDQVDYELDELLEVVFSPGETSASIHLSIIDDPLDEYDELVTLQLGLPVNAVVGSPDQFLLTILDNDLSPQIYFEQASQSVEEASQTLTAQILLSAPSALPITVSLNLEGSAYPNLDYVASAGSQLVFAPGSTRAAVSIDLIDDTLPEPNETVIWTLIQPRNAGLGTPFSHNVTILINDQPTCNIFTRNELYINPEHKKVLWTVSNLGEDTLILTSLTIAWPTNASNAPKFDFIKFNGNMIWDGNEPHSPATANSNWIGFDSYRVLSSNPTDIGTYFTRTLLPGTYTMTLVFYNVQTGANCSPVVKSAMVQ